MIQLERDKKRKQENGLTRGLEGMHLEEPQMGGARDKVGGAYPAGGGARDKVGGANPAGGGARDKVSGAYFAGGGARDKVSGAYFAGGGARDKVGGAVGGAAESPTASSWMNEESQRVSEVFFYIYYILYRYFVLKVSHVG